MITDSELDDRLRAACQAVIPQLMDGTAADSDALRSTPQRGRFRPTSIAAAIALLVGVGGVYAVASRDVDNTPLADTPIDASADPATNAAPRTLSCDDNGCHGWNELPVAPGVTDYYLGPESLGTPKINLNLFESLTNCAELDPTFTTCTRIEGISQVSLVDYPVPSGVTIDTVDRSELSYSMHVTTTFTDSGAAAYVDALARPRPGATERSSGVTVRGHDGLSYVDGYAMPAITWEERPGVLVTVSGPPELEDQLPGIAEGIRQQTGPATIPNRVILSKELASSFDNNSVGMLVGRLGDQECFGYQYIDNCDQSISALTRPMNTEKPHIAGAVPPNVDQVQVTLTNGTATIVPTATFANYTLRFYEADLPQPIKQVDWLDQTGQPITTLTA